MQDFGDIEWNQAEEDFPPETPMFRLRVLDGGQWTTVTNISNDRIVEVDCYTLAPNDKVLLEDQNIVSIYGWESTGTGDDRPLAYLYGFDPASKRLVRHDPDRHGAYVKFHEATKRYTSGKCVSGIEKVSFEIMPSTLVGVYGPSGAGKTVLINSLVSPVGNELDEGFVKIDDVSAAGNPYVAYLPQHLNFPDKLTVGEIIKHGVSRTGCDAVHMNRVLDQCHLTEFGDRLYGKLSGGQQRRLALAMALLDSSVRLIVADEPTTGLDIATEREVMRGLRRLVRLHNVTVVVVSHSVSALPIFDKVIVLSKPSENQAAKLCFDSQWLPEYFPCELRRISQDSERLTALFEGQVAQDIPVKNKFGTPHDHAVGSGRQSVVHKLHSWWRQALSWVANCSRLVFRQKKTLAVFLGLAVLCAIMIQLGTGCGGRRNEVFLSFMSLCAPWLCATYTVMFGADLLKWFSWGKLYGGSARSFETGVLGGLMIPYACVALIFTLGLFFKPNMNRIVGESYKMLERVGAESCISRYFSEAGLSDYEKEVSRPYWHEGQPVFDQAPQIEASTAQLGCDESQGYAYSRDFYSAGLSASAFPWKFIVIQWGLMSIICLIGGSMGLAAIAWFREAKTAVLAIVILYICFIMLSRICVDPPSCMYALTCSSEGRLPSKEAKWIPLIYMSYLGIGRYVYNVLAYPLKGVYLYDWLPLIGWYVGCIGITWRRLANIRRNWVVFAR